MATIKFNTKTVAKLKPLAGKRVEYFDASTPRLGLRITENGAGSKPTMIKARTVR